MSYWLLSPQFSGWLRKKVIRPTIHSTCHFATNVLHTQDFGHRGSTTFVKFCNYCTFCICCMFCIFSIFCTFSYFAYSSFNLSLCRPPMCYQPKIFVTPSRFFCKEVAFLVVVVLIDFAEVSS